MAFWAQGFWAPGFWAPGFWAGMISGTTSDRRRLGAMRRAGGI